MTKATIDSTLGLLLLPVLGVPYVSFAQDRIDTNRPSFSASPYVLKPGNWQLETGIDYERGGAGGGSTLVTLPLASLRFGLMDEIELHVDWKGVSRLSSAGETSSGVTDPSVGIKVQVTDDQAKTAAAFLADLTVPVGDVPFTSDRWNPSIGVAWAHSGSLNWAGTAVITSFGGDYVFDNGVMLTFVTSDNSSAFVEWQVFIPDRDKSAHKLNGGYLWWSGLKVQFDVNASLGLNDEAADYSLGFGWSYHF